MSAPETFAYWGLVVLDRFEQLSPEEQAKAIAFGERLKAMSEHELFTECKEHIWTEAVLESRSRYSLMSDLKCAMCCVESNKRAPEGVKPYSAETIYARAHAACMAEAGVCRSRAPRTRWPGWPTSAPWPVTSWSSPVRRMSRASPPPRPPSTSISRPGPTESTPIPQPKEQ